MITQWRKKDVQSRIMAQKHTPTSIRALCLGGVLAGILGISISGIQANAPDRSIDKSDAISGQATAEEDAATKATATTTETTEAEFFTVISVIDGDTFKVNYEGSEKSVRLIGVNTPETVDPRTTVECYGEEASDYLKTLLTGKQVKLEVDPSQTDRDKYDRLLRYAYLDGADVGEQIIRNGYGHEDTYDVPYAKQAAYKQAQENALSAKIGLWGETCQNNSVSPNDNASAATTVPTAPDVNTAENSDSCNIKGNISYSSGEKIYHMPGQRYYDSTEIDTSYGERWFCSEAEAQASGWRRSKM